MASINLAWTADTLFLIGHHFFPLRYPARGTRQSEYHGEHVEWHIQSLEDNARVEIHIWVKIALDKVFVFQSDTFELLGNFKHRLINSFHIVE